MHKFHCHIRYIIINYLENVSGVLIIVCTVINYTLHLEQLKFKSIDCTFLKLNCINIVSVLML